ncbi:MAG: beta-phosphoglucomutase [Candidatus Omnitrophica bacterium]|nr:beta-phosphoglucomutase [Candidatus Omnitrophota bacterium]
MHKEHPWKLIYKHFEPEEESLRETLCTLGNGYFGTRGAAPETVPSEMHYPGTYVAGLYNRLPTNIAGRTIYNEDLVNCPNWIYLTFKIRDGVWFSPSATRILSFHQELDIRHGKLVRKILCQMPHGRRTWIHETRIVSMANPHIAALRYEITPDNYSDYITVRSMLDGAVLNMNVERYRQLNFNHWESHVMGKFTSNGVFLGVKTSQSKIELYEAAKLKIFSRAKELKPTIETIRHGNQVIGQQLRIFAKKHQAYSIEKTVSIYTSKDKGVKNAQLESIKALKKLPKFNILLALHVKAWQKLWDEFDVEIEGDVFSQQVLRLHIFHLLQTASPHNKEIDAGLPARGLHGEAYRGHVFWDEVFVLPFFNLHMPRISKALLLYRYNRLEKARQYAIDNGYKGAMFPWQSGSSGREETQVVHLNPRSGKWGLDYSRNQRHVSLAIAYNAWNFWKVTNDLDFLEKYGAEIILSIAQFAGCLCEYDAKKKKYHVRGVMGPDEFHEKFPGISHPGLIDNAYTNVMIVWTIKKGQEILKLVSKKRAAKLKKKLKLTEYETDRWERIIRKMNIIIDKGIIAQFKGYFKLKELDWVRYKKKYKNIHRMDRILKAEGKSPNNYKVAKQADVLMIFYLLTLNEVEAIFKTAGYNITSQFLKNNYDYYIKRTSHGSTLSKVVHCFISQKVGKAKAFWDRYEEVLKSDIYDTQGGTTTEGIHAGVMGGSLDIAIRSFAGIQVTDSGIEVSPKLPHKWRRMKFSILYKGQSVSFDIKRSRIKIALKKNIPDAGKLPIKVNSKKYLITPGATISVSLAK